MMTPSPLKCGGGLVTRGLTSASTCLSPCISEDEVRECGMELLSSERLKESLVVFGILKLCLAVWVIVGSVRENRFSKVSKMSEESWVNFLKLSSVRDLSCSVPVMVLQIDDESEE